MCEGIYLGYLYARWRKLRGLNLHDPIENKGQFQSKFKDLGKGAQFRPSDTTFIEFNNEI